ncbi:MAG TPA: arsenate reductase ArsC [Caproicibacter sp.]|nr:arsenate reductase ArsC [Caproicibacter sp.]
MSAKLKVAFVCTHNSCRSQMAEAICKIIAADIFEAYSAGTEVKKEINPNAVETIKELYGVDMTLSQRPKLLEELPSADIVVTMGCGVQCPYLPCRHREDWGLEDPTGKPKDDFVKTANIIKEKITELMNHIPKL